jgi:hypothetical protein
MAIPGIAITLADAATIAGIVSSAALTISLVYVALQVRQAEKNQRGLMQQGRANRLDAILLSMAEPQIASVWLKGSQEPSRLSALELEQFLLICRAAFLSGEDSFLQHKAGLLDELAFRSYSAGARGQLMGSLGMRAAWRLLAHQFGPEFVAFMEEHLSHLSAQGAPDRLEQWSAAVEDTAPRDLGPLTTLSALR